MPLMKVKADLARPPRALVKVVTPGPGTRASRTGRWSESQNARQRPQQPGPRHRCGTSGGGHRQHYRMIDFRRDKDGIQATVERLDYDPNRSAHLALLSAADGERRYIIAPRA